MHARQGGRRGSTRSATQLWGSHRRRECSGRTVRPGPPAHPCCCGKASLQRLVNTRGSTSRGDGHCWPLSRVCHQSKKTRVRSPSTLTGTTGGPRGRTMSAPTRPSTRSAPLWPCLQGARMHIALNAPLGMPGGAGGAAAARGSLQGQQPHQTYVPEVERGEGGWFAGKHEGLFNIVQSGHERGMHARSSTARFAPCTTVQRCGRARCYTAAAVRRRGRSIGRQRQLSGSAPGISLTWNLMVMRLPCITGHSSV